MQKVERRTIAYGRPPAPGVVARLASWLGALLFQAVPHRWSRPHTQDG